MFLVFPNMSMHTELPFYDKYYKNYMILGYNKRQPVAMAAILNTFFPPLGFLELFTRVLREHPSNFPDNFSFLQLFLGWILMLLGYTC